MWTHYKTLKFPVKISYDQGMLRSFLAQHIDNRRKKNEKNKNQVLTRCPVTVSSHEKTPSPRRSQPGRHSCRLARPAPPDIVGLQPGKTGRSHRPADTRIRIVLRAWWFVGSDNSNHQALATNHQPLQCPISFR